jgi:hypothetical protein
MPHYVDCVGDFAAFGDQLVDILTQVNTVSNAMLPKWVNDNLKPLWALNSSNFVITYLVLNHLAHSHPKRYAIQRIIDEIEKWCSETKNTE